MKTKLIALAVVCALCLGGLTACSSSSSNNTNNANNTNNSAKTTNTTNIHKNNTSSSDISSVASTLEANLSTCYMGVGGDYKTGQAVDDFDVTYYMGFSSDSTWGIVVAVDVNPDSDGKYEYISFVGYITSNGDNSYTIVDDSTQVSLTFTATAQSDGTWILDLGPELGKAQVGQCTSSDLVTALTIIDENGKPMN